MESKWPEIELSEVISDIAAGPFGSNLKVNSFVEYGFPIVDGANLKGIRLTDNITKFVTEEKAYSLKRSIAKRGDLVATISGTIGQIAYIPDDSKFKEYLCSQRQFRISFDKSKADPIYMAYYFHTYEGKQKILSFGNQVGVPALTQPLKNFKLIKMCLPPLPVQQKIASILGSLDDKIELNNRMIANLEEQAKAMFKAFNASQNCETICFEDNSAFGRLVMGLSPKGESYNIEKSGMPLLNGAADYENLLLKPQKYTTQPTRCSKTGDLIFCIRATIGLLVFGDREYCLGRGVAAITDIKSEYREYIYHIINSSIETLKNNANGSVIIGINKDDILRLKIKNPPREDIADFHKIQEPIFQQIEKLRNENKRLAELRDTLLPKLMSGEIDVEDIEI